MPVPVRSRVVQHIPKERRLIVYTPVIYMLERMRDRALAEAIRYEQEAKSFPASSTFFLERQDKALALAEKAEERLARILKLDR
jgi:hypothetical protein